MRGTRLVLAASLVLATASRAAAQAPSGDGPDPPKARIRLGVLRLKPTFALTDLGIDTNVFNEAEPDAPKRDFTLTLTPQTDLWMRIGRTRLTGNIKADFVWFRKYAGERSANTRYTLAWRVPLNRLTVTALGSRLSARERPGFEIDARSHRTETAGGGAIDVRVRSKTFLGLQGEWRRIDFDRAAVFLGTSLQDELNRIATSGMFTVRHQVTPLTSLTFAAARASDRFERSPLRDSDSTTITGTVSLDPFALIKGDATLGYRHFAPRSPGVPGYRGPIATVDLSYILMGTTRFAVHAVRDVHYSYNIDQPYYVLTGFSGSVRQPIFHPFDLVARAGVQRLDYRDRAGVAVELSNRIDRNRTYGGGIGYRVGRDVRVGLSVDRQARRSGIARRQYNGLRYGTTVTYGL